MTYREKLQQDHPERVAESFIGGYRGCPGDYYSGAPVEEGGEDDCCSEAACKRCWDMEAREDG